MYLRISGWNKNITIIMLPTSSYFIYDHLLLKMDFIVQNNVHISIIIGGKLVNITSYWK